MPRLTWETKGTGRARTYETTDGFGTLVIAHAHGAQWYLSRETFNDRTQIGSYASKPEAMAAAQTHSDRLHSHRSTNPMTRRTRKRSSHTGKRAAAKRITAQIKKLKTKRRQLYR